MPLRMDMDRLKDLVIDTYFDPLFHDFMKS